MILRRYQMHHDIPKLTSLFEGAGFQVDRITRKEKSGLISKFGQEFSELGDQIYKVNDQVGVC